MERTDSSLDHPTHLELGLERLKHSKRAGPLVAVGKRFMEIDGFVHGALIAVELFTTVIPLMIIGFSYFSGFAENASAGNIFIRALNLHAPLDARVREAFGTSSGIKSTWTIMGVTGFLLWGIPMSLTVATMFARAWRREQFGFGQRLGRGAGWFVLYLLSMSLHQRMAFGGDHGALGRLALMAVALVPVWAFWSVTPVLLVRDGARGWKYLLLAGLAGVVIEGIVLPVASRIAFPILLEGWTGFGPIGVAMTMMTWCGVIGIGWVVTASAGATLWERNAPAETVVEAQIEVEG